ncbi:TetR/AcrR family transcriptional regulator [Antribacter gilvus]|uniref:TetR/AcrR family transcriptional regulator n=1 Tax=Antribacter gilvus TaxID=2304675 RepID=UPI000F79B404|nr:TetR/AcrR family transcriptional regulator [Antribacter gilvus]
MTDIAAPVGSRRDRLQQELQRDVLREARAILSQTGGIQGVTMAAVAKAVGVTAPALYRYFDGRGELIRAVYEASMDDLLQAMRHDVALQDPDDLSAKIHAATRAIFRWTTANRPEFDLLMGSGFRGAYELDPAVDRFFVLEIGTVYVGLFEEYVRAGLPYPTDDEVPAALRPAIERHRDALSPDLPLGVAYLMSTGWRQVVGLLSMAAYGHLEFAYQGHVELFDDMMVSILTYLNLEVSPDLR